VGRFASNKTTNPRISDYPDWLLDGAGKEAEGDGDGDPDGDGELDGDGDGLADTIDLSGGVGISRPLSETTICPWVPYHTTRYVTR
jgi:hypothetical protein